MKDLLRILIVEDSEDDAILVLQQIKKGNYEVQYERVETASAMRDSLNNKKWDVILSDYSLPSFNGIEALKILQESGVDLPFILVSGVIGEDIAVDCMKAGADDYLMKDSLKRLLPAIERGIKEARVRSEGRLAERKRNEHFRFLESLDLINRAIQGTNDFYASMSDALEAVISIFECDRAFLMYPCDPDAPTWSVPLEKNKPEFPGVLDLNLEIPMDSDVASTLRLLLESDRPVQFGPGTSNPLPPEVSKQFDFKNFMSVAIHPRVGKAWQFGIHQCAFSRTWNAEDERLLMEIGRRLEDGITSLLSYQNLQASEEKFSTAFRLSPITMAIVHVATGKFVNVNDAFIKSSGYTRDEIIGRTTEELNLFADPKDMRYVFQTLQEKGMLENYEFKVKYKSGKTGYGLSSISVIKIGDEPHYLSLVLDITERKKAEKDLQISEQRFKDLFNKAGIPLCLVNKSNSRLEVNESFLSTFGYKREEIPTLTEWWQLAYPDSVYRKKVLETCGNTILRATENNTNLEPKEYKVTKKDGEESTNVVFGGSIGEEWLLTFFDITERKRDEIINASRIHLMQYAATHSVDEFLEETLNVIEKLTDSFIGFYHFVNDNQTTLTLQSWSTRTKAEFCKAEGEGLHYSISEAGIWTDCIKQRKPVIHNDYISLTHRKGMPEGHAEVIRELVVPVFRGSKIKAVVGVGNKSNNYEETDIEIISLLGDLSWEVAERKRAEEALQASEAELRALITAMTDTVLVLNAEGRFIKIAETNFPLLYKQPEEILGKTLYEIFPKTKADMFHKHVSQALNSKKAVNIEYCLSIEKKNIWFNATISPKSDNEVVLVARDITARKHAEDALRESESRYRMVFENSPVSIWEEDFSKIKILFNDLKSKGVKNFGDYIDEHPKILEKCAKLVKIVDINKAALELHKSNKKEELISNLSKTLTPESFETFKQGLIYLWNGKTEMVIDAVVKTLEGDSRYVTIYFTVCPGYENTFSKILFSLIDITDRKIAEKTLHDINEKLHATLETAPVAVFDLDTSGRVKSIWNSAAEKMLGWNRSETIGHFLPTVPEDKKEEYKESLALLQSGRSIIGKDLVRQRKDGTRIEYSIYASPEYNDKNEIIGNIAILVDITERKKSEAELRRVMHAVEQSPVSVVMTNTEGDIVYVNPRFTEITGYNRDEVYGENSRILKSGDMKDEEYKQMWETITSGREWHGEFHNKKKNGELFWEAASISAVRNEMGDITHYVAIKENITEQKRILQALKSSEDLYRTLVSTVPDIIIRTDIDKKIVFINESILRMYTKMSLNKILGRNLLDFISAKDRKRANENSRKLFRHQLGLREYRLKFGRGKEIDCEVNSEVLRDSQDQPFGIVYVFRDISARKKAEMELEKYRSHLEELIAERTTQLEKVNVLLQEEIQKQKEAEQKVKNALEKEKELSNLKTQFISLASHEFRTPLTTVLSSTELLNIYKEDQFPVEHSQLIERIKKSVKHLTNLMDDVLTISRAETGKLKFLPVKVNIEKICSEILDDIKFSTPTNYKINYSKKIKTKWIVIDEKLFKLIVLNLLTNAIKYSPNGGEIKLSIKTDVHNLLIEVSDNGIGIPEKDRPYLFEPFHRGSNVSDIRGTGLGMSIIKKSVDMHKGSITFDSIVNKGSIFYVSLPYKKQRRRNETQNPCN